MHVDSVSVYLLCGVFGFDVKESNWEKEGGGDTNFIVLISIFYLVWTKLCRQNNEEDNQSKKPFVTATSDASDHRKCV